MATISDENMVLQQLGQLMRDPADPDAPSLNSKLGRRLLDVTTETARNVRTNNKAATGKVTVTFSIKSYRTKNKEVATEIDPKITVKMPDEVALPGIQLFADHDGALSTVPVQEDMGPLFTKDTARSIEGGKSDDKTEKKGKKAI